MKKLLCRLFGHKIGTLSPRQEITYCLRCNQRMVITYDMCYGATIYEEED